MLRSSFITAGLQHKLINTCLNSTQPSDKVSFASLTSGHVIDTGGEKKTSQGEEE